MRDQADRLRQLALQLRWRDKEKPVSPVIKAETIDAAPEPEPIKKGPRIIAVTSGKGGVGKTNLTANLALSLSQVGYRTVLLDADLGLANVDVLFGIVPQHTLKDVIDGSLQISEILTPGPLGLTIIAGGNGITELADLNEQQVERFIRSLDALDELYDFILIDTGAGIGKAVLGFVLAAHEIIVITTPEPTSITDAYATIKAVCNRRQDAEIRLVINRVANPVEAQQAYDKIRMAAERFLGVGIPLLGSIPDDPCVVKAVMAQQPFSLCFPHSEATLRLKEMASALIPQREIEVPVATGVRSFFSRVISLFR
ncbi:MAG: MinD/ParA family protein [Bacillota bacterium]